MKWSVKAICISLVRYEPNIFHIAAYCMYYEINWYVYFCEESTLCFCNGDDFFFKDWPIFGRVAACFLPNHHQAFFDLLYAGRVRNKVFSTVLMLPVLGLNMAV